MLARDAHPETFSLTRYLPSSGVLSGKYVLHLQMQPIMAVKNPNETLNFEILLRANDIETGLAVAPGAIVEAAEKNGDIQSLDKWVIDASLDWITRNLRSIPLTQCININLSALSFADHEFQRYLSKSLDSFKYCTKICLELTEGISLVDFDFVRAAIKSLRRRGVRVAIDDFGAGYASFNYLKELSVDAIKIDGALIKDMLNHPKSIILIDAIARLSHALGMKVVAEWAEDDRTIEALKSMNIDFVQGFAISKPRHAHEILAAKNLHNLMSH